MTTYRADLPPRPAHMLDLPLDHRGFPVPWFTPRNRDGTWNFQAIEPGKPMEAMRKRVCWVCGKGLFKNLAFVIGPMCSINRVTAEFACHTECAEYTVKACPFMTQPRMRRPSTGNEDYLDDDGKPNAPGVAITRNPGVSLIWVCRDFKPFRAGSGYLFRLGWPLRVSAWREKREATQDEIIESIRTGLPELIAMAPPGEARAELRRAVDAAWAILKLPPTKVIGIAA